MLAKGHVQPHHNNVPRRRQRTQSPLKASSQVKSKSSSVPPHSNSHARAAQSPLICTNGDLTDSGSTASSTTIEEDKCERPSPGTFLTSPSNESLLGNDALLITEKLAPSPARHHIATCDGEPTSPFGILPPPDPTTTLFPLDASKVHALPVSSQQPRVASDGARGHLEPRAANVPRRLHRAQKERERVRRRHFQELITGSRVWIAFDTKRDGSDYDSSDVLEELTVGQKKERDWMWDSGSRFGFSGVIRVRLGKNHGECRRQVIARGRDGDKDELEEEMHLVIGREQAKECDDSGISALTDSQLEVAASFLIEHRQRRNASGKVLIMAPPSRPVESLSIALFALSLPSTSTNTSTSINHYRSPSYLSQFRFLPGIIELEQSQDVHVDDGRVGIERQESRNSRYSLIQLALWHLHDLIMPADEYLKEGSGAGGGGGLTMEWRGALSLEGVQRLESLVLHQ